MQTKFNLYPKEQLPEKFKWAGVGRQAHRG